MKKLLFLWLLLYSSLSWSQPSGLPHREVPTAEACFSLENGRQPLVSAHRGGRFLPGYPENALETFEYVSSQLPLVIIECDISMTKDSVLVLLHDRSLNRTTTGSGNISEKEWDEVSSLFLVDDYGYATTITIPTLVETLNWCKGRAILNLDVKKGVPFDKVLGAVEAAGVEDNVAVITYNLQDALQVHALNPRLMLSVSIRNEAELAAYLDSGIHYNRLIAFTGVYQRSPSFYQSLHDRGIASIIGTMGNLDNKALARGPEVYQALFTAGADIFATDRPIEAWEALRNEK